MAEQTIENSVIAAANSKTARRRRNWREFKDKLARVVVTGGGIMVIVAIVLIFFYAARMNKLDRDHGVDE